MHHPLCVSARQLQIHLTHEQQQILSHDIQPDHVVKIVAFAGKLDCSWHSATLKPVLVGDLHYFLFIQTPLKL